MNFSPSLSFLPDNGRSAVKSLFPLTVCEHEETKLQKLRKMPISHALRHPPLTPLGAVKYVPGFDILMMDSSLRLLLQLDFLSYPPPSQLVGSDCRRGLVGRKLHCGCHFLPLSPDQVRIFESFHPPFLVSCPLKLPKHSPGPVHALLDLVVLRRASSSHEEDSGVG